MTMNNGEDWMRRQENKVIKLLILEDLAHTKSDLMPRPDSLEEWLFFDSIDRLTGDEQVFLRVYDADNPQRVKPDGHVRDVLRMLLEQLPGLSSNFDENRQAYLKAYLDKLDQEHDEWEKANFPRVYEARMAAAAAN